MGFIKRCGRPSTTRDLAIPICVSAALLGLIAVAGCGSSPGSPQDNFPSGVSGIGSGGSGGGGSGAPSSSCSASRFVRPGHKPVAKLPVLVSVQLPVWDVPAPEVNIDEPGPAAGDTADEAKSLANQGDSDLNEPANALLQGSADQTDQQAVDQEATGVGLTEEVAMLNDDAASGESASEFGQSLCNATGAIAGSLSSFNSVKQLYANLGQDGTTASADLAKRIADGINDFTSVFGPCIDTLDVAERIVEDIDKVFCGGSD